MQTAHALASVALADLLVLAHERRAACHVAEHQDHDVDAEEDVGHSSTPDHGVSDDGCGLLVGRALTQIAQRLEPFLRDNRVAVHVDRLQRPIAKLDQRKALALTLDEEAVADVAGHDSVLRAKQQGQDHASDSGDADQHEQNLEVERDGGHGSGRLVLGRACLDQRFESHLAFGEIANSEHELRRHSVVSHLGNAARRDAESISKRFGSAALTFEPSFEIHGASLEQPKRLRQGFSKPRLFILG